MNRVWTKWAGVVVFSLAAAVVSSARAAPPLAVAASQKPSPHAVSRAENLVLRALSLMQKKKWLRAARLLETSIQLDPDMGAQAALAECYEALRRPAQAWMTFTAAADHASRQGLADNQKAALLRAQGLEPRVVLIVLNMPPDVSNAKGLRITVDGIDVVRRAWAEGAQPVVAVDPGKHVLMATAPGKIPWHQTVRAPDAGSRVTVDIPPMVSVQAVSRQRRAERTAAIASGSIGAVATAAGIAGVVLVARDQPSAGVPMAISGFTVGVPSVITAVVLGAASRKQEKPANSGANRWRIVPAVGTKAASVVVTGEF
jgi:DNA-binding NarL/FixJ family response regulator